MDIKIARSHLEKLSGRFNMLIVLSAGLLIANIGLVFLLWWSMLHEQTVVVPVTTKAPFSVSASSVDASYLKQMSLVFLNDRLNITPDTVDENNKLLLHYIAPEFYHEMSAVLASEQKMIKQDKVSSVFYPGFIKVYPKQLAVQVKGVLKRWVGERPLPDVKKDYVIAYGYGYGKLTIKSFTEKNGEKT